MTDAAIGAEFTTVFLLLARHVCGNSTIIKYFISILTKPNLVFIYSINIIQNSKPGPAGIRTKLGLLCDHI